MKKLILLFILFIFLTSNVYSATITASFVVNNASNNTNFDISNEKITTRAVAFDKINVFIKSIFDKIMLWFK